MYNLCPRALVSIAFCMCLWRWHFSVLEANKALLFSLPHILRSGGEFSLLYAPALPCCLACRQSKSSPFLFSPCSSPDPGPESSSQVVMKTSSARKYYPTASCCIFHCCATTQHLFSLQTPWVVFWSVITSSQYFPEELWFCTDALFFLIFFFIHPLWTFNNKREMLLRQLPRCTLLITIPRRGAGLRCWEQ